MMVARAARAARATSAAASPHPSARWKRGASPVMLATLHGAQKRSNHMAAVPEVRYASLVSMAADGRAHDSPGRPSVAAQLTSTSAHSAPRPASRPANPKLASVATALPAHVAPQAASRALAARMFEEGLDPEDRRLIGVFESSGIEKRHFCMPLDWYAQVRTFGDMNARYVEHAIALATEASRGA